MLTQVNTNSLKYAVQEHFSSLIVLMVIPVLLFFCILSSNSYFDSKAKLQTLVEENDKLQKDLTIIKLSNQALKGEIDDYNKILSLIIPEAEDYFTIILALERLSEQTGFIVYKYNINLLSTNKDKIALVIEGDGDADSFLTFLNEYQFSGGRLITNERIEFTTNDVGKIKLGLNFYHAKIPGIKKPLSLIPQKDILLMRKIKEKTSFMFKEAPVEESTDESYELKENPF